MGGKAQNSSHHKACLKEAIEGNDQSVQCILFINLMPKMSVDLLHNLKLELQSPVTRRVVDHVSYGDICCGWRGLGGRTCAGL